ncbi:NADP-dependent L-serine/L-allo-threonine dehydrogenase ydfG [Tothia fuscella]|uniref:NADP-dependent L-serine/L-allo-threonine dehydrogenase ydfG n=1 Tax=Tothia fuscella TaxID=1048955 RepID=A0A9P4NVM8_9PEZI|nr:NADP-dependent L-serine/L-allo-threonine dehydrogenase ydfG [Tothia fuscella]
MILRNTIRTLRATTSFYTSPRTYFSNPISNIFTRNLSTAVSKRLNGKTVLITGASSGIGRSTAVEFARQSPESLKIIITARREERLNELAKEIKKEVGEGVKVFPVKLDVSNTAEMDAFMKKLPDEFRDVDILVNNAGLVKGIARAPHISPADITTMFTTNTLSLIHLTQTILPTFLSKNSGTIINIGSIAGREGYPGGSIYCATKAAVKTFTDALRKELIATKVRVICVDPGQVESEFSVVRFGGDKEKADKVYEGCEPLTPEDVAEVVVFAAGRRENVVVADTLIFPNHQAAATVMHRKNS